MIPRLLFKKQQGISVKLARITKYLTCKVRKRQSCDYIKNHRENCFIIYNQTTHGILLICFFNCVKLKICYFFLLLQFLLPHFTFGIYTDSANLEIMARFESLGTKRPWNLFRVTQARVILLPVCTFLVLYKTDAEKPLLGQWGRFMVS